MSKSVEVRTVTLALIITIIIIILIITHDNRYFAAKIKETLHIKSIDKNKITNNVAVVFIFAKYFLNQVFFASNEFQFVNFSIIVLIIAKLLCKHLKRKM